MSRISVGRVAIKDLIRKDSKTESVAITVPQLNERPERVADSELLLLLLCLFLFSLYLLFLSLSVC